MFERRDIDLRSRGAGYVAGSSCPRKQAHFRYIGCASLSLSLETSGFLSRNFPLSEPYFHTTHVTPRTDCIRTTPCGIPAPRSQSSETAMLRSLPPLRSNKASACTCYTPSSAGGAMRSSIWQTTY
jgi:hypothetical protein